MMNEEEFDELSLPRDSNNENLETLSRLKFAAMFPIELFELRDELQRDKGVDVFVELKRKGRFTNFRLAIQLKATRRAAYNADGSLFFGLDVSNINYLLNHNMPAYYILYDAGNDHFLYAEAFSVFEQLNQRYTTEQLPRTFTYRFSKRLDLVSIQRLYNDTFEKGRLFREINPLLQMNLQHNQMGNSVVISDRKLVYTTAERVTYLQKYGFYLLNAGEFNEVIKLVQQCYPLPEVSGAFHYVAGMAYYHQANMYKAIDHFKLAAKTVDDLHPEMGVMLGYYAALAKFALGILSTQEIGKVVDKYKHSEYVGLISTHRSSL